MGKRLPHTPTSQIVHAIRLLWLRSRERQAALKRSGNTCECCGRKQSVAKGREVRLEVHHLDGIEWQKIIEYIRRHVLVDPKALLVMCKECHAEEHEESK